jgi:hypothetical protein
VLLGDRQLHEQRRHCLLCVGRQAVDERPEAADAQQVHPPAHPGGLAPSLVERQVLPRARPKRLAAIIVRGAVPGDVGNNVARPAATQLAVDGLRDGVIAPLPRVRRRGGVVERLVAVVRRQSLVVLGILHAALPQRLLDVGGSDVTLHEEFDGTLRGWERLTVADVAEQAPRLEEPQVRQSLEGIHGDVVLQRPDRRDERADVGDRRRHQVDVRGQRSRTGAGRGGGHQSAGHGECS